MSSQQDLEISTGRGIHVLLVGLELIMGEGTYLCQKYDIFMIPLYQIYARNNYDF